MGVVGTRSEPSTGSSTCRICRSFCLQDCVHAAGVAVSSILRVIVRETWQTRGAVRVGLACVKRYLCCI